MARIKILGRPCKLSALDKIKFDEIIEKLCQFQLPVT